MHQTRALSLESLSRGIPSTQGNRFREYVGGEDLITAMTSEHRGQILGTAEVEHASAGGSGELPPYIGEFNAPPVAHRQHQPLQPQDRLSSERAQPHEDSCDTDPEWARPIQSHGHAQLL